MTLQPGKLILAATPTWNPTFIKTALWLDAADASTITESGGAVSQWDDKSGNGNHVAQADPNLRPAVTSNVLNAKPVIRFDGINDRLQTAAALFATPVFGVYSVNANRNPAGESAWAGQYIGGDSGRTQVYQNGISTRLAALFDGGGSVAYTGTADSNFHLFGYEKNLNNAHLYYEAVSRGTTSSAATTIANTSWKIGDPGAGSSGNFFPAALDAAEIVILSAPASTSDRQKIEGYLAHKWGLTANLPADHPYKTVEPTP